MCGPPAIHRRVGGAAREVRCAPRTNPLRTLRAVEDGSRKAHPRRITTALGLGALGRSSRRPGRNKSAAATLAVAPARATRRGADDDRATRVLLPPAPTAPNARPRLDRGRDPYHDGDPEQNRYGTVQVRITVQGNTITAVDALQMPYDHQRSQTSASRPSRFCAGSAAGAERADRHRDPARRTRARATPVAAERARQSRHLNPTIDRSGAARRGSLGNGRQPRRTRRHRRPRRRRVLRVVPRASTTCSARGATDTRDHADRPRAARVEARERRGREVLAAVRADASRVERRVRHLASAPGHACRPARARAARPVGLRKGLGGRAGGRDTR